MYKEIRIIEIKKKLKNITTDKNNKDPSTMRFKTRSLQKCYFLSSRIITLC